MAAKKRRKRRFRNGPGSAVRKPGRARIETLSAQGNALSLREHGGPPSTPRVTASVVPETARHSGQHIGSGRQKRGLVRLPLAVLLPGLAFFGLGRPGPGLACLALQATLVGWAPAAIWATCAARRVRQKQRALADRVRPGR